MGFVSDVSRVFVVAVSHGLGPNLAAFRGFCRRYLEDRGAYYVHGQLAMWIAYLNPLNLCPHNSLSAAT